MNLNLDGTELTKEQLLAFAAEAGCDMEKLNSELIALHNANMQRSLLTHVTREIRLEAFMQGRLLLQTKLWEAPTVPVVVNKEIFDFLANTIKKPAVA